MDIYAFDTAEDLVKFEPRYMTTMGTHDLAVRQAKADIREWQETWMHRKDYIDGDAYLALSPAM